MILRQFGPYGTIFNGLIGPNQDGFAKLQNVMRKFWHGLIPISFKPSWCFQSPTCCHNSYEICVLPDSCLTVFCALSWDLDSFVEFELFFGYNMLERKKRITDDLFDLMYAMTNFVSNQKRPGLKKLSRYVCHPQLPPFELIRRNLPEEENGQRPITNL